MRKKGQHVPIPAQKPRRVAHHGATPSTHLPPSARMQSIKRAAKAVKSDLRTHPLRVALPARTQKVLVVAPIPKAVPIPLRAVGPDTPSLEGGIEGAGPVPEKKTEIGLEIPSLEEALSAALPEWGPKMRKVDLLKIALGAGLDLTGDNTKKEILAALDSLEA